MVLVGTRHSTVQIYLCENSDGLVPIKEQSSMRSVRLFFTR